MIQLLILGTWIKNFALGPQFTFIQHSATKYSNSIIDVNTRSIYVGTNVTMNGISVKTAYDVIGGCIL